MTTAVERFAWDEREILRVGALVSRAIAMHVGHLATAPAFNPVPAAHADHLRHAPLPLHPTAIDAVLDEFTREVSPYPFGNGSARFFGWVNSPPALAGVFAASLAAAMNPSVAGGNHAAVYIEHAVASWLATLVGFPPSAKGILVSGTSAAAIVALNVARFVACQRVGWDVRAAGLQTATDERAAPRMLVYRSAEGHACHQKAVELLGLGSANLRLVRTDGARRIDPDALDAQLSSDRSAGCLPVAVIATVGTVSTGAIDPLPEIADVCERHGVWLHVDGAYGAPAVLTDRYSDLLRGLTRADSIAVDPHKWLYVPVDAGYVVIKHGDRMRDAASLVPPYLRTDGDEHGVQGPPWFSEYGIEQTRPFRALKVWMSLKVIGLEGYRELIAHDLDIARYLADHLRADRALEVWEPQELSIVCFRVRPRPAPADAGEVAADAITRALAAELQRSGEAFVSTTVIDDRSWVRACVINPRTTEADIDRLLAAVRRILTSTGGLVGEGA